MIGIENMLLIEIDTNSLAIPHLKLLELVLSDRKFSRARAAKNLWEILYNDLSSFGHHPTWFRAGRDFVVHSRVSFFELI
jgi:hypothetical protein